jgi:iron complex outermembrane receptor protein
MPKLLLRQHLLGACALLSAAAPSLAASAEEAVTNLSTVQVSSQSNGFRPAAPAVSAKSELPLEQTPLSLDVLGRALLDSQQIRSLNEALQSAGGAVGGTFGRRGWDDFIIRGQTASDSVFLDGLRSSAGNRVAEQMYGLEQVEILKGPASLLYGQVQPGGMVNLVSKRPLAIARGHADLTVGSYGQRQASADLNLPLDQDRAALRVNALASNSDDATDHVWSRERFIAPALALNLGEDTDFVLLTSYQQRRYIRQQGLPLQGAVLPNRNGALRRTLFTGEPGQEPYDAEQARVGWQLDHRFDNGWRLHHGLRWQQSNVDGDLVANETFLADQRTLRRSGTRQHWGGRTWTQDTYLARSFGDAAFRQELIVGLNAFRTWEWASQQTCQVGTIDVYAPVYTGITCDQARSRDNLSVVTSGGLYLRDSVQWGEDWLLQLGLRHDKARVEADNRLLGSRTRVDAQDTTGSVALMYQLAPGVRPYLSYATSFTPNAGTDAQGAAFEPEQGKQWELGVKYALGQHVLLTTALYDLRRRNVLQSNPLNDGYSIAIGEQRSRGGELEVNADLDNGISLNASYAYTDARISDDGDQQPSTVGTRLPNVPRHSGSVWLRYDPRADDNGWYASAGARAADARISYGYRLAGYTVFDAGLGYRYGAWDYALNVRNLLDRDYFSGGLARAVALGDPRTLSLRVSLRF